MSKKIILACMCIMALGSCKKDYQKLATEFERALPDTVQVVLEQINEIDQLVYFIKGGELYRHNLENEKDETVKPRLGEGEGICNIFVGKENIAFLIFTNDFINTKFQTYNLKTQKFKDVALFSGTVHNDVEVQPSDSTISGFLASNVESYTRIFFDYDGNKIREEEYDDPNLGDYDVPSLKYWQCMYCGLVIKSSNKPEEKQNDCPKREHSYLMYTPHVWQYIGDAQ